MTLRRSRKQTTAQDIATGLHTPDLEGKKATQATAVALGRPGVANG